MDEETRVLDVGVVAKFENVNKMGKATNNSPLRGVRGKLGKIAVFKEVRGKTVTSNIPREFKSSTEGQIRARLRFQEASFYGKHQVNNPGAKAMYARGITAKKHNVYLVAMSDYLRAPEVKSVDTTRYTGAVGQSIIVKATDDFQVRVVNVIIRDAAGNELERGTAVAAQDILFGWVYTTTSVNPALAGTNVIVTASDIPGNRTEQTFIL